MKRSPIKRKTRLRARVPQGYRMWQNAKAEVRERSKGECEVRSKVCTGRAEHCHHVLPRSAGGFVDTGLLLDACAACHGYLHAHPAESYQNGWLVHGYGSAS